MEILTKKKKMKKVNKENIHNGMCDLFEKHSGLSVNDISEEQFMQLCVLVNDLGDLCSKSRIGRANLINK